MTFILRSCLLAVLVFSCAQTGSALTCNKEGFLGIELTFSCPLPHQPESHIFCCGDEENRYCCPSPLGDIELDQETVDNIVKNLPRILGIIVGGVVVLLLVCVVCCCCCPFCMLAKRRNRGHVTRGATEVTVTVPAQHQQQQQQPLQPYGQQQQPYIQPQGYPQPGYPPQQPGYPPQSGYPGQQMPYPTGPAGPPPPQAGVPAPGYPDQPPPYAEKQPPFNPNYGA